MRRAAPGKARGRLPARLLGLGLALLQAPPAVQTSERFLRSAGPRQNSLKIVGSVIFSVKVYVKLNHNSPRILCLTNHLQNSELIDPIFQWNGPGGSLSSENSSVQISPTGTLILRHFNLSGVYTCSIVYKLIATQPDKNLTIKYLTYGKLSIQAKDLIERFFTQQGEVSRQTEPLPEIGDVEGTLQTVWADGCYPGYGMNASIHPDCPKCCVICSPGSYNPSDGIHCLRCNSSLVCESTKC